MASVGQPQRGVVPLADDSGVFAEFVLDAELPAFQVGARCPAWRECCRCREGRFVLENCREEELRNFIKSRTTRWCLEHLVRESRSLEPHMEFFRSRCLLGGNQ